MKINLTESDLGFGFSINDESKTIFSSSKGHLLTSGIEQAYQNSWEACRDARKFVENNYLMHVAYDASSGYAEGDLDFTDATTTRELSESEFIQMNYLGILKTLAAKTKGSKGDDRDLLHKSLTSFIYELSMLHDKNKEDPEKKEETAMLADLLKRYQDLLGREFNGQMADVDSRSTESSRGRRGHGWRRIARHGFISKESCYCSRRSSRKIYRCKCC
jgi:hypothetical protein